MNSTSLASKTSLSIDVPDSSVMRKRKSSNMLDNSIKRVKSDSSNHASSSRCEPGPSNLLLKRTTLTQSLDLFHMSSQPSTSSSKASSCMDAAPINVPNLVSIRRTKRSQLPPAPEVNFPGVCNICRERPNTAVMVHNGTGHQYCCYKCSLKLKRSGKGCPVCRKPITHIIKNFIVFGDE